MWLLMISLMLRLQCMNICWRPPGFFPSPVCRASTVSRDTAVSPLLSDSSGQSRARWSIQGPGSVADSSLGDYVPALEIPQVVAVCFLWWTHICRARHSMRAGTSAVLPKPMLTGTHFMVRHFRGMTSSEDSPSSSPSDANGGLSNDNNTRWRFHLSMILRCTGRSSRKALTSSLMYTQWHSTEATDVQCDIIVDGRSPSLKRCIM